MMERATLLREKKTTSNRSLFYKPTIQKKMTVGSAHDAYEVEADTVAKKVMQAANLKGEQTTQTGALVQRKCVGCEEEEKVRTKPLAESITPLIQRSFGLTPPLGGGGLAPSHVESQINNSRGGGSRMDTRTKNFMESRFGIDFSEVKIHTNSQAVQMSRDLNAQAFTVGNDIYFNQGKYSPNSNSGKHLLAHELTHTVQQGGGAGRKVQRMKVSPIGTSPVSNCGSYSYKWKFELDKPAPCEGFMVQKVNIHEVKKGCSESPVNYSNIKPKETFWESWHHKKGDKVDVDFSKYGYSDNFSEGKKPNSSGTHSDVGYLKFFCMKKTGNLNTKWSPNKYSGGLPASSSRPKWWNDTPIDKGYHYANAWWNCCRGEKKRWSKIGSHP